MDKGGMVERVVAAFQTYSIGSEGASPGVCRIRRGRELIEEFPGWFSPEAIARCEILNARAAIEAMREPMEVMVSAGSQHIAMAEDAVTTPRDDFIDAWRYAIDAAVSS